MSPATRQTEGLGDSVPFVSPRSGMAKAALYLLCFLALYQFCHFHLEGLQSYLDLGKYVQGLERMPFQARILPMYCLRLMQRLHFPAANPKHVLPAFSAVPLNYLLLLDYPATLLAFALCVRLYRKIRPDSGFSLLVFPVMLFAACWSYLIHVGYNLYYPYDMLSLAFFTAGLYFIYTRRFLPLMLIVLVGTTNRETTLFLIPIFILDYLAPVDLSRLARLPWSQVPWLKVGALVVAWAAVKTGTERLFPHNDTTEAFVHLRNNLKYFKPQMWPQALSGCGYLLPVVLYFRRWIPDGRIAAYLLVIPIWFVVMLYYGVLIETRIYGELCPLIAIACVLLIENVQSSGVRPTVPA